MLTLSNNGNSLYQVTDINFCEVIILLERIYPRCKHLMSFYRQLLQCLVSTGITGRKFCTSAAVLPVAIMKSL